MQKRRQFRADKNSITEIVEFIEQSLNEFGIKRKAYLKALLIVEEASGSLIEHYHSEPEEDKTDPDRQFLVALKNVFGNVTIELSTRGREYPLARNIESASLDTLYEEEDHVQDSIRNVLLKSLTEDLEYRHLNGVNYIRMTIVRSRKAFLYRTIGAMIAAIILGLAFSAYVPEETNAFLNELLLVRVKTMYMNALKMVVAPVVFFSIVSCIVQFSDLSSLGRIGGKIIGLYLFTTVLAVFTGVGVFAAFAPANVAQTVKDISDASSITSQTMEVSIPDTIVGIIPSDIISPFQKSNMLQLIFIAVLCGISTGLLGRYSQHLTELFHACNDLFLKITSLIIKFMPIAVFCSIMSMVMTMGIGMIISLLGIFGLFILGLLAMMAVYCLLMVVLARLNPIPFVRKYMPFMIQVFAMASSNASIPVNMDACEKKLGVSKKIYSLSIPLGATLNMDGTCIYLAIFALGLAGTYGVEVSQGAMLSMVISIIVLSIGAPGIPGSGLICLSVLLTQLGVPVEAVGLIMGIDSLCGMFRCMSNCLGDVAVTAIVAKSEGVLDMKKYARME
ncbi:MAG TPA: hypothetical protein DCS54_00605 [Oribacterium sp.]|nr:hypothetical protein [Oribacterium sp.]